MVIGSTRSNYQQSREISTTNLWQAQNVATHKDITIRHCPYVHSGEYCRSPRVRVGLQDQIQIHTHTNVQKEQETLTVRRIIFKKNHTVINSTQVSSRYNKIFKNSKNILNNATSCISWDRVVKQKCLLQKQSDETRRQLRATLVYYFGPECKFINKEKLTRFSSSETNYVKEWMKWHPLSKTLIEPWVQLSNCGWFRYLASRFNNSKLECVSCNNDYI